MNPQPLPMLRWLITFSAVFTAGAVGFMLPSIGTQPTLPLLAGGIAAAACIRWGRWMWPAVLAAGIGVGTLFGQFLNGALRNPSAVEGQFGRLIFGFAVTEALGIFALLIAFLLLFAV